MIKIPNTITKLNILISFFLLLIIGIENTNAQQRVGGKQVTNIEWQGKQTAVVANEITIKLEGTALQKTLALDSLVTLKATKLRQPDELGWMLIKIPESEKLDSTILEKYRKLPGVRFAEPNIVIQEALNPNDLDNKQYALNNTGQAPAYGSNDADIDAPEAWDITTGSSDVIIAILDSGIPMENGMLSHPDLDDPGKIILGPDYISDGQGVRDLRGHGTHVAGIAAAESNNNAGITGTCWNCKIMPIQVFDAYGNGNIQAFYDGVKYASDFQQNNPGKRVVINFSGGSATGHSMYQQAIQYAKDRGVFIVASAGNQNGGAVGYPAAYAPNFYNLAAVSSTDHTDTFSSFSSKGPEVSFAAPGGFGVIQNGNNFIYNGGSVAGKNIYSTTPNYSFTIQFDPISPGDQYNTDVTQNYGYLPGTSMAAPHVAGIVGLMLSANPSLVPGAIKAQLRLTADKVSGMNGNWQTDEYGAGRVNAYKALKLEAAISGLNIYNYGSYGAWFPDITGGVTPFSYSWYRAYNFFGPYTLVGTSSSYSQTVTHDMYLKLQVTDPAGQFDEDIMSITVNGSSEDPCPMCPQPKIVSKNLPRTFSINQNYPNPFNPSTQINYDLPESSEVRLEVFNILGKKVATLVNQTQNAGTYTVNFDGQNLASGLYIARLEAVGQTGQQFVKEMKMQLIK